MNNNDILLLNREFLYKIESFRYSELLRDIMETEVFLCRPHESIQRVAQEMAQRKISSVVITDKDLRPLGIVTERDIVRNVVATNRCDSPERAISEIMTSDPICLSPDDSLFDALSVLSRHSIKHLPLLENQRVTGMVALRQIMKMRYTEPMVVIGQLLEAKTISDFRLIKEEMIPLVQKKLETNTDPIDIVTMISLINMSIHKQLLNKILKEREQPPVEFCFFVTGSLGRRENLLFPDQDFCVILDDYDDRHYNEFDRYFYEISRKLSDSLHEVGFAYCPGHVMGQNPTWRKRISEWKSHISYVFKNQGPFTVRYMTLLFDSAPLFGKRSLFRTYQDYAYDVLSKNRNIIRQMHEEEEGRHKVPLSIFHTFLTEKGRDHRGQIDMKRSGLIFIIESVRILSMKYGIRESSTMKRLQSLVQEGVINRDDSEYFENSYKVILYHTLKAQLGNFLKQGVHDYHLKPNELSAINREMLKQALLVISRLQDIVGSEFGEPVL